MPLFLDIDAHGRVVPQSDEVRRALADRAGRFLLLPAAPDLLLARRSPAAGGPAPRPRCMLAGDLNGFPVADLVAFLHQSRMSGVLTISAGGAERSLSLKDGEVRRAVSSLAGERLEDIAVRLGFATEQQISAAAHSGKPLGRALVDAGVLGQNELWKCFHEQVTTVFHSILIAREGTFQLVDEDIGDRPGTPLAVNTQSLLMDGIRRIDEMSLFVARIPGPRAYVRPRRPSRAITLQPPEHAVLALVDGKSTVAEIAGRARLSEFDATKILYHLAEAGYVEAVARPREGERGLAAAHGRVRHERAVPDGDGRGARGGPRRLSRRGARLPGGRLAAPGPGVGPRRPRRGRLPGRRDAARQRRGDEGGCPLAARALRRSGPPAPGRPARAALLPAVLAGDRLSPEVDAALGDSLRPRLAALEASAKGA